MTMTWQDLTEELSGVAGTPLVVHPLEDLGGLADLEAVCGRPRTSFDRIVHRTGAPAPVFGTAYSTRGDGTGGVWRMSEVEPTLAPPGRVPRPNAAARREAETGDWRALEGRLTRLAGTEVVARPVADLVGLSDIAQAWGMTRQGTYRALVEHAERDDAPPFLFELASTGRVWSATEVGEFLGRARPVRSGRRPHGRNRVLIP